MSISFTAGYLTEVSWALLEVDIKMVEKVVKLLGETKKLNKTVYLVGNGGSATTAMHFAQDLQKMCGIRAIAVPALIPNILAYGNDTSWENMFAGYLGGTMEQFDVLVAISCSGSSPNVLKAVDFALKNDLNRIIGFTGQISPSNPLARAPGLIICVNSPDIKVQEDVHLAICHSIVGALSQ